MFKRVLFVILIISSLPLLSMKRPAGDLQPGGPAKIPRVGEGPIRGLPNELTLHILTFSGQSFKELAKSTAAFLLTNQAYSQLLTDVNFLKALVNALNTKTKEDKYIIAAELMNAGLPKAQDIAIEEILTYIRALEQNKVPELAKLTATFIARSDQHQRLLNDKLFVNTLVNTLLEKAGLEKKATNQLSVITALTQNGLGSRNDYISKVGLVF
jgi:hypothetical protein